MTEQTLSRATHLIFHDERFEPDRRAGFQLGAYADVLARLIAARATRTPLDANLGPGE